MTDKEMTGLCADSMGYTINTDRISRAVAGTLGVWTHEHGHYYPLHSDVQAMALIKEHGLSITFQNGNEWIVTSHLDGYAPAYTDLNRAIVECVAKMQSVSVIEGVDRA